MFYVNCRDPYEALEALLKQIREQKEENNVKNKISYILAITDFDTTQIQVLGTTDNVMDLHAIIIKKIIEHL